MLGKQTERYNEPLLPPSFFDRAGEGDSRDDDDDDEHSKRQSSVQRAVSQRNAACILNVARVQSLDFACCYVMAEHKGRGRG